MPLGRDWNAEPLSVDLSFRTKFKVGESSCKAKAIFRELETKYQDHHQIFTDGSVDDEERVGIGIVDGTKERCARLPEGCNIFSTEAKAIRLGMKKVNPEVKTAFY